MISTLRSVSLALVTLAVAIPCHAQSVADILEHARPAAVTITTRDSEGKSTGLGSGFIVRADGVVITAWHVVSNAATAKIKLQNGKEYVVKGVLAKDAAKDYALLKVEAEDLPVLPLGDSDHVRQGDRILTLGSPQGLEETASEGMVSAVRMVDKTRHLQITAPISHGNSGGPVLNMQGEAVGIAVFFLKDSQSLNFAVAVNQIKLAFAGATTIVALPGYVDPSSTAAWAAKLKSYRADQLFKLGNSAWSSGKPDDARKYWDAATEKDPKMLGAWLMAAQACSSDFDWKGAVDRLNVAIQRSPKHGIAHMMLGEAYDSLGSHDHQAVSEYRLAVQYCITSTDKYRAYTGLGRLNAKLENYKASIQAFKSAILADGPDYEVCFYAGFAFERLGRHEDAEKMLAQGRKLIPDSIEAWTKLGNEWSSSYNDVFGFDNVRWRRAAEAYEKAIASAAARKRTPTVDIYYSAAEAYEKLNRWQDVITSLLTALKIAPHNGQQSLYRLKLGEAYLQLGELDSAKAQNTIIRSITPSCVEASILRDEIAKYGVPVGKIKVCGNLTVWMHLNTAQRAAITKANVTVDGKRIEDASFYMLLDAMVDAKGDLIFELSSNTLADAPHAVEVTMTNRAGTEIAQSKLTLSVDNSRPESVDIMKDFTLEVTAGPPVP